MKRVIFAGFNSLNRKIIPWHPQLDRLAHITKIQAEFDSETRKFRVLKKVVKDGDNSPVEASISAQDIKDELRKQEEAKLAKQAEEARLLQEVEAEEGPSLEEIVEAAAAEPKPSKFTAPKVGL